MAFIPLPNGIKISMEFYWSNVLVVVTLHVTTTLPIDQPRLTNLGNTVNSWLKNTVMPALSSEITNTGVVCTDVTSASGPSVPTFQVPPVQGGAGSSVPNNAALVTTFETGLRGRSFRGRAYMPGLPMSYTADSVTVQPAVAANFNGFWNTLFLALIAASFIPVVASYHANKAPRVVGVATPIQTERTETSLDSQRRRLLGS